MDQTQTLNHLTPEAGGINGAENFTCCGATASRCRLGGRRRTNLFVRLGEVPLKPLTTERPSPSSCPCEAAVSRWRDDGKGNLWNSQRFADRRRTELGGGAIPPPHAYETTDWYSKAVVRSR